MYQKWPAAITMFADKLSPGREKSDGRQVFLLNHVDAVEAERLACASD